MKLSIKACKAILNALGDEMQTTHDSPTTSGTIEMVAYQLTALAKNPKTFQVSDLVQACEAFIKAEEGKK